MPYIREQTPPPSFIKSIPLCFSHTTQSAFSNNTIPSQYPPSPSSHLTPSVFSGSTSQHSDNMIPPQYSNMNSIHSQSSNHPTPAEQNAILSQTWLWVPYTKCSLYNDPDPDAVYLITLVTFDGYKKRFHLRPLAPTGPRNEIISDVLEQELISPREATFHHSPLPIRPEPTQTASSSLSVGVHGRALGISISTIHAPSQPNTGSDFIFSQYESASPRQYNNERYSNSGRSMESGYYSGSLSEPQSDRGYGRGGRRGNARTREQKWMGSGSREREVRDRRRGESDREWRRDGSREVEVRDTRGGGRERQVRGRRGGERERESRRDGNREREVRDRRSGESERESRGRRTQDDRDEKRSSGAKKDSSSGKKEGSQKDSSKGAKGRWSKEKDKSGSKGKKIASRSSSASSSKSFASEKKQKS